MEIREAKNSDIKGWLKLRMALWPDAEDEHLSEINKFFSEGSRFIEKVYVVDREGDLVGFMELNIRSYAEGSRKSKVPYVEGWYIVPEYQGQRDMEVF